LAKVSHFRYALRFCFTIFFILVYIAGAAQTLGGSAAYNFLSLSGSTQASAAGGQNVSYSLGDVGFATQNPALWQPQFNGQLALHFTDVTAGIKALHLSSALHHQKQNTTFGGHVFFIHYGSLQQTDAAGNVSGTFQAYDYVVQLAAAKQYLERWQYGGALKWIQSIYGAYNSSALAVDFGLLYKDSLNGLQLGLVAKNMGVQVKAFAHDREELPFDLQVGITKKLSKAPLAFSLTLHHLHRFSILYDDSTFNRQNNFTTSHSFFNKVFNHFVLATHVSMGQHLEATIGYNVLRRTELSVGTAGNGLSGFSAGLTARFQKLQFHYARSTYQKGIGNNQLGVTVNLQQLGGIGNL